ncbi:hypothetical protein CDL15_Pgr001715 [Punica granatum]|uniref:Uncharacterized protein n=1 Tax=Punica granatum TaxID=22663 RepID=A0A218XC99_PUNGR|nr:hypothetical protein CDL15_Pgr001715 [Punica granatum]
MQTQRCLTEAAERAAAKPSRSDEVVDAEQQLRMADQVRAQFDSIAPKRPAKPSRSESDSEQVTSDVGGGDIPELDKLRSLQSQSQIAISKVGGGAPVIADEFVETQYYTELCSIDRQHHTTGNGFINVERGGDEARYGIQLERGHGWGGVYRRPEIRSNPAMNDWVPIPEEDHRQVYVSSKPNRSEGSN